MKVLSVALALTALASSAPLGAQILGSRVPTTSGGVVVDGSWRVVGRDGNNTIYERRTRDRNGNIVVQRAVHDGNGNMRIISTRTENDDRYGRDGRDGRDRRTDCDYNRSTNSIGDIIFGRTNDRYCDDVGSREDGGWYQVGRGRDNSSIYERRTRDRDGNLVIQRARRDSNGRMRIISTRRANDNDKQWRKEQKRQEQEWKKDQKRQEEEWKKEQKRNEKDWKKGKHGDRDHDRYGRYGSNRR